MRALDTIRQIDQTIIFARDLARMRHFYAQVLRLPVDHELGPRWIAFRVGPNLLTLTERGLLFDDPPTPPGALAVQLAFRVALDDVARCFDELAALGVPALQPVTDQPWGHRTLFVRDPDGNVLEFYANL